MEMVWIMTVSMSVIWERHCTVVLQHVVTEGKLYTGFLYYLLKLFTKFEVSIISE